MNERTVITIGREFGSGGHDIGQKLAEEMGVKCYDKELLQLAAKESGLCEELFANHDEKPTNSFLYSLVMDTYSLGYTTSYVDMPINHKVFIKAPKEARIERVKKLYDLSESKAADLIHKNDKRRASYYNYYTSKKWGEAKSYDLCIDSSKLGTTGCIELIKNYIEIKEKIQNSQK